MSPLSSDPPNEVITEYIWIGESGLVLRSKAITVDGPVGDLSMLPKCNFDVPMTNLVPREDGGVILYPQAIFKDPFRRGQNILVMCDAYTPAGEPIVTNNRHAAAKIFSHPDVVAEVPWYTIVQVYTLLRRVVSVAGPQGPYYCRIIDEARGKEIATSLEEACRYAGIDISVKAGVMPGQWEFQVGPAVGISAGDEFWVARYTLERIAENDGVVLSFDPKPIQGDRNGAGSRTNFSTESMRNDGGHEAIRKAMERFALRGKEQIWANYFTGCCETADINSFLWGFIGSRGGSNGVGRDIKEGGKGFLEYGRPASNMDPYAVTSLIAETTILWKAYYELAWERVWRWVVG